MKTNFQQKLQEEKSVIVIGAGPIGLATAVKFQEEGYKVTVLEAEEDIGFGISNRPEVGKYAIVHSGAYYPKHTLMAQYCAATYKKLEAGPEKDDTVMRIYRQNTEKVGKLIIARNEEELLHLKRLQGNLEGGPVKNVLLTDKESIRKLNEPTFGNANDIVGVLHLPDVRVLHIRNYLEDLRKEFVAKGGEILYRHRATEFVVPRQGMEVTGILCQTPDGEKELHANKVINMAGLYAHKLAKKSREALISSGLKDSSKIIGLPEVSYFVVDGIVPDKSLPNPPKTRHLVYSAHNDLKQGQNMITVGFHSYLSERLPGGLWTEFMGPFCHKKSRKECVVSKNSRQPVWTPEIKEAAINVDRSVNLNHWHVECLGGLNAYKGERGKDFYLFDCKNRASGFDVHNSLTSPSPGLTCSPVIADYTFERVKARFDSRSPMASM